jgi:uncharacterized protein (DUF2062 family)
MAPEEHARQDRHERFRIWKKVLRFVPRRTAFHRYPLVGRFAAMARKRAFLWSFKIKHLRPAFYSGSILAVMPVLGVQVPAAFLLALLFRANFMILGGIQFITNPVTAAPIYFATHKLGSQVIEWSGFGGGVEVEDAIAPSKVSLIGPNLEPLNGTIEPTRKTHWSRSVGTAINSLVIGGAIIGTLLGTLLDFSWRLLAERFGPKHLHLRRGSRSTEPTGPPK